ncbi:MAG: hypothetical protein IJ224_02725 [Lachnospiraceae bacterium]|nr:hypothetical protein [Lachnospiraceae bacterium]
MSAVFYLLSVVYLWVAVFIIKKSDTKVSAAVWFFCSIFFVICNQVFFAGILNQFHIGISIISIGIINFLVAAIFTFFITRIGIQKYYIKPLEIIELLIITGVILRFALIRFGHDLHINFVLVDASSHYGMSKDVALNHTLDNNMYFAAVTSGLMMEVYKILSHGDIFHMYRMFILCEIVYTALTAFLFWILLHERFKNNVFKAIAAVIITVIYWIGYPAYSTIFGYSYFVMGINIITILIFVVNAYLSDKYNKKIMIIFMNLLLHGIFVCYTLFVPTTFFGIFAAIAIYMIMRDGKKFINVKNIVEMLYVFLIPTILGLIQSFSNVQYLSGSGDGISHDGGCYSDFYSNFIPLIPFAIIGIYIIFKEKKKESLIPVTVVQFLFMLLLFFRAMKGTVSAYYYMKNNSLVWTILWVLTAEAIFYMIEQCKGAVIFPVIFIGFIIMGLRGDNYIMARNDRFIEVSSKNTFNIIYFNDGFMHEYPLLDSDTIDLYEYVYKNCQDKNVISVNSESGNGWFNNMNSNGMGFCYGDYTTFESMVDESVGYICICYTEPYFNNREYFDLFNDIVYENQSGRIVRINPDLFKEN